MNQYKKMFNLKKALLFLRLHLFLLFAIVVYVIFTSSYMGPAFFKCNDSIYGFGDSTAGPIWRNSIKPDQPILGGSETVTNYPMGESLYSPVNTAVLIQSTAMSVSSRIVGPVCSYNLYNIFSYIITAIIMFAFVLYLTKNKWVALLAGYAVSFTPYVQSKIGGHPSYGYAGLLIAALWLAIHLIVRRQKKTAILLGIVLGACAYLDPYFILLAMTVGLAVLIGWVGSSIRFIRTKLHIDKKKMSDYVKSFGLALMVFGVIITPLLVVRIKDSAAIDANVGAVRGDVTQAAMLCSNTPIDYLLPDPMNVYLQDLVGVKYTDKNISLRHWCGSGESRVSISLIMLGVILLGSLAVLWERLHKRPTRFNSFLPHSSKLVVYIIVALGLSAFMIGLPPYVNDIITPSGIILKITETWRIFAREYLLVNVAVVLLFSLILTYLSRIEPLKNKKYLKLSLYMLIFVGIVAEYQINRPFNPPVFSYSRDIPNIYETVKNSKDITAIAEYPIDRMGIEYDSIAYYLTMQVVHGKKLLNSAISLSPTEKIHIALKDLSDPQTIPALRGLGIKYIIVHGVTAQNIKDRLGDNVEIIEVNKPNTYSLQIVRPDKLSDTVLVKLKDGPIITNVVTLESGFVVNLDIMKSPIGLEYETIQDAELKLTPIRLDKNRDGTVCFDAKTSFTTDVTDLQILINGVQVQSSTVNGEYSHIEVAVNSNETVVLHNTKGYNLRINNLGCKDV